MVLVNKRVYDHQIFNHQTKLKKSMNCSFTSYSHNSMLFKLGITIVTIQTFTSWTFQSHDPWKMYTLKLGVAYNWGFV